MLGTVLKIRKLWVLVGALVLATLATSYVRAAVADSVSREDPQQLVADSVNKLLTRLRENSDRIRQDQAVAYEISDELVAPNIDFPRIARLVIGKYWRSASKTQKQRLVTEIRDLLVRSYVTAMTSYIDDLVDENNMIEFLPSRYQPGDRKASVRANIALGGRPTAQVDYQLYYVDKWKIYDIRIEGISLAITYRTSFGEQIEREGLESLIAKLEERNRRGEVELPNSLAPEKTTAH
jgi:phospholipid transport system substrate-binding protein